DSDIDKKFITPRNLLETIAQLQGESGYPYIMFYNHILAPKWFLILGYIFYIDVFYNGCCFSQLEGF
ncbi:MAG: hypothetical protein Q8844_03000, partial [Pigeon pea little leaf phytoplasma]|nr:hypothetical protein [Pigeon pea little leaf phytoplasma]